MLRIKKKTIESRRSKNIVLAESNILTKEMRKLKELLNKNLDNTILMNIARRILIDGENVQSRAADYLKGLNAEPFVSALYYED